MASFQTQFDDAGKLIDYEDFTLLTKRIIDFTLDTENLEFYRKTVDFLDWLDTGQKSTGEKKERYLAILDGLYKELSVKNEVYDSASPVLSVFNLIKSYKKSSFALEPISFDIKEGEIVGLVGENGNGKTTLSRFNLSTT